MLRLAPALAIVFLALAGCASAPDESAPTPTPLEPLRNTTTDENATPPPASSNMCVEGAEDCVDTVEGPPASTLP